MIGVYTIPQNGYVFCMMDKGEPLLILKNRLYSINQLKDDCRDFDARLLFGLLGLYEKVQDAFPSVKKSVYSSRFNINNAEDLTVDYLLKEKHISQIQ